MDGTNTGVAPERQLKITEMSLCFYVRGRPKTPVDSAAPFVIDRRGEDTERVVPVGTEAVPNWVSDCKKGHMMFTYASELQNVECSFRTGETNRDDLVHRDPAHRDPAHRYLAQEQLSTLTLHGIKQRNFEAFFNSHLDKVFQMLGAERDGSERGACCTIVGEPRTTYKATFTLDIGAPWDRDLIADVITNDPEVSQMAAMSETVSTLGNRSLFSVSVATASGDYARATLRPHEFDSGRQQVTVAMSRLSNTGESVEVAEVVEEIFRAYSSDFPGEADNYEQVPASKLDGFSTLNGIGPLRSELPELFINNYTRECPVLPIMVSQERAELLMEGLQRVIFYPVNSPLGRYYTAPKGYFVGLKKNRLANRGTFPCLVTCYLHDHMMRKGSETHKYYTGEAASKNKQARPVPRSMAYSLLAAGVGHPTSISNPVQGLAGLGYGRRRTSSFVRAVEAATGEAIDTASLPWCPQVVKQEMWDIGDDEIMATIRSGECGPLAYRYFEELLAVSIHVVVIRNGMFESLVHPHCIGPRSKYIWAPPYLRHVVIFETIKKTYGETRSLYDILVKNGGVTVFDSSEPAVMSVVAQKSAESVCPPDTADAVGQLIDERGKCRMIITPEGEQRITLTRPLKVPVIPDPVCFFDLHTSKMNEIKSTMGLCTTDLYKRSTSTVLYFPNDASFDYWMRMNYGASTHDSGERPGRDISLDTEEGWAGGEALEVWGGVSFDRHGPELGTS